MSEAIAEAPVTQTVDPAEERSADHPIDPAFLRRWSPRAMSGEEVNREDLLTLFEAARWAPSSYNNQPWRFLYARRKTENWQMFCELLTPGNRKWAANAGALLVILSKKRFDRDGRRARTHSFDAGAAWENLALQGSLMGLVVHGMEGFDYAWAREVLKVPRGYEVEAMAAVGHPAPAEELPPELAEREQPSERKPLDEIVNEGRFPGRWPADGG